MLVQNEFKKLQRIDSSYFRGKSRFEEDAGQNYLIFNILNQCTDLLKRLVVLLMVIVFIFENPKVCLMNTLILSLRLITVLL